MIYRFVKKAEILPLSRCLIARLPYQFNHIFALLIFMPAHFKNIIITKMSLKLSYFGKKIAKSPNAGRSAHKLRDSPSNAVFWLRA